MFGMIALALGRMAKMYIQRICKEEMDAVVVLSLSLLVNDGLFLCESRLRSGMDSLFQRHARCQNCFSGTCTCILIIHSHSSHGRACAGTSPYSRFLECALMGDLFLEFLDRFRVPSFPFCFVEFGEEFESIDFCIG